MFVKIRCHMKNGGVKELFFFAWRFILIKLAPCLMFVFRHFGQRKKVVFSHFDGKAYGGNPGTVCDELIRRKLPYTLVWICDKQYRRSLPSVVKWVPTYSIRQFWALSTAAVWVDDCRKASCIRKGKHQYYIQTWHGGGPCLKKIEGDAKDTLSESYIRDAKNDSSMADLFLSCCEWRTRNYRSAFWYNGEILKCGEPDSDVYLENPDKVWKEVYEDLKIPRQSKIVLYAPTFRNSHNIDCYKMNYQKVLDSFQRVYGGQWCLLLRLHPAIMNLSGMLLYSANVINASEYPHFENLLIASEVLITDYSACMFEAYRLGKNVFLYMLDYDRYISGERELYFNLNELPAEVAKTEEELIENIVCFDRSTYEKKVDALNNLVGYYPFQNARKIVADRIISVLEGTWQ